MSEEKLPVCGCAQSHMYKVAYVLPLIDSELFIRVCGVNVCVCVCVCVCACVCVCVVRVCARVCVCVLIVVSMVMRWDTTSRRRGGSLLLNSINLVTGLFLCFMRKKRAPDYKIKDGLEVVNLGFTVQTSTIYIFML